MKRIIIIVSAVLAAFLIIRSCGGDGSTSGQGGGKVSSLYGTYVGTDDYGNTISITLKPDSDNEWRKFGEDNSSTLVYKDSKGRIRSSDGQSIQWTWDFDAGYVQTYYLGNERTIIDFKHKKFYKSYGEFLDNRNGIPYNKK